MITAAVACLCGFGCCCGSGSCICFCLSACGGFGSCLRCGTLCGFNAAALCGGLFFSRLFGAFAFSGFGLFAFALGLRFGLALAAFFFSLFGNAFFVCNLFLALFFGSGFLTSRFFRRRFFSCGLRCGFCGGFFSCRLFACGLFGGSLCRCRSGGFDCCFFAGGGDRIDGGKLDLRDLIPIYEAGRRGNNDNNGFCIDKKIIKNSKM